MRKIYLILLIALLSGIVVTIPVSATTWYVDDDGGYDYTSIQAAIDAASSGDVIFVYNGTYGLFAYDTPYVTVTGESADVVTVDCDGLNGVEMPQSTSSANATGCILEGIKVVDSAEGLIMGRSGHPSPNCVIRNCVFDGMSADLGLYIEANFTTFENNIVSNTTGMCCGASIYSNNCTIVNNTFINNAGAGLGIEYGYYAPANNIIVMNDFISNYCGLEFYDAGENNKIFLNNFIGNYLIATTSETTAPTNTHWNSTEPLEYVYNSTSYTGYLGNFWDNDYTGSDNNGDGIGNTSYTVPESLGTDYAPLIAGYENYPLHPVADFSADVTEGFAPLVVQFTDLSSYAESLSWDFDGDGIEDFTEQNPQFNYTTAGNYTVNLTVCNSVGNDTETKVSYITVHEPLVADFTADITSGSVPLTVSFTDLSSGNADSWFWDFDNDGMVDSTEQNPQFNYTNISTYNVTLTVSSSLGNATETKTDYITVTDLFAPVANFTADATIGYSWLTVNFTDLSSNNPTSWEWDFEGDGIVDSTEQNPVFNFTDLGSYNVTLTAANSVGNDTETKTDYIVVSDWNPWNDPDSVSGRNISTTELFACYACWRDGTPASVTGAEITATRLEAVYYYWKYGEMPEGTDSAPAITANRVISNNNVIPNSTFMVTVDLVVEMEPDQFLTSLELDEKLPVGWDITPVNISGWSFDNSTSKWTYTLTISSNENLSLSYYVTVSSNATLGTYNISGNVSSDDLAFDVEVAGDSEVNVSEIAIVRTITPLNVNNKGGSFDVSVKIMLANSSGFGAALYESYKSEENMQDWNISNISVDPLFTLYEDDGEGLYDWWIWQSAPAGIYYVNYTMTVGDHEPPGIYEISGTWEDYGYDEEYPVIGDTQVILEGEPVFTSTDWTQFQSNLYNNGVTSDLGPIQKPDNVSWATYTYGKPGWYGIDTEVLVVGDLVYAVTQGGVYSVDWKTGEIEWTNNIRTGITSPLGTPVYGNGKLFVGAFSKLYAFDALNGSELWNVTIDSDNLDICQINTPLTYDNGRIYFGEWLSYTLEGDECKYYCYNENGTKEWARNSSTGAGYYWAGAAVVGQYLVYPDDNMNITSVNKYDGETVDEVDVKELLDIGYGGPGLQEIRASLMYDPDLERLYTTTQDGYCIYIGFNPDGTFNTSDSRKSDDFNAISTTTPTLYNGKVYVGTGTFTGSGKFYCLNADNLTEIWNYTPNGGIQASPVVSTTYDNDDGEVYIYFTTNILNGTVYCLKDCNGNTEPDLQWTYSPPESLNEYTLHGVSLKDGRLFYGNDRGYVFCLMEDDWNPWNDPDSSAGRRIANTEIQAAVICWKSNVSAPYTGAEINTIRLNALRYYWANGLEMPEGTETAPQVSAGRSISGYNVTPDSTFTVSVDMNIEMQPDQYLNSLTLNEEFPSGWNITSVDDSGWVFDGSGQWSHNSTLLAGGNFTFVYNVTVPGNLTGGIYNVSGSVSATGLDDIEVGGDSEVYVMDDWNPWNDWDSEGSPNGRYITIDEVIDAYNCYTNSIPAPRTGAYVTIDMVTAMHNAWRYSTPM
jgi:PKD repeat protein